MEGILIDNRYADACTLVVTSPIYVIDSVVQDADRTIKKE